MNTLALITWSWPSGFQSTWLRGYFDSPRYSFEETVARLKTLSGQDPTEKTDEYKVSVEFQGTYRGAPFTLYDYKGDNRLHVGGNDSLDVPGLIGALDAAIQTVEPTEYRAVVRYDDLDGAIHGWPS